MKTNVGKNINISNKQCQYWSTDYRVDGTLGDAQKHSYRLIDSNIKLCLLDFKWQLINKSWIYLNYLLLIWG